MKRFHVKCCILSWIVKFGALCLWLDEALHNRNPHKTKKKIKIGFPLIFHCYQFVEVWLKPSVATSIYHLATLNMHLWRIFMFTHTNKPNVPSVCVIVDLAIRIQIRRLKGQFIFIRFHSIQLSLSESCSEFLLNWKSFVSCKCNLFLFYLIRFSFFLFHIFFLLIVRGIYVQSAMSLASGKPSSIDSKMRCAMENRVFSSPHQTATERLRQFQMNGGPQHGFEETIHRVSFAHQFPVFCLFNLYYLNNKQCKFSVDSVDLSLLHNCILCFRMAHFAKIRVDFIQYAYFGVEFAVITF